MKWYLILLIILGVLALVTIIVGASIIITKRIKNNKKIEEFPELLNAFGGKNNIKNITPKGSRISIEVEDKKIIDKEIIKQQGVETIVISNKKITLVVGNKKAMQINEYLSNSTKSEQ